MHLYLHIPFCRKACHYCDFHFSTQTDYTDRMVNAICTELVLRKHEAKNALETIYFGGGTPSVLSNVQLEKIFRVIHENYLLISDPEITLEANPDDLTEEKLTELKNAGITRLSIGIQSFREDDLQWMNRSHNALQAVESVKKSRDAGIDNITIDLIYGIPGLSASDWEKNLMKAVELNPQHISAYCLTIEKKTVFGSRFQKGHMKPIDEEQSSDQFLFLRDFLAKNGYQQYEISNFAQEGFESRHNTSYWKGKNYLGIGPSAHSYNGILRRWNVSNNMVYMQGIEDGLDYFEEEELSEANRINETIMISLRTVRGIDLREFEHKYGAAIYQEILTGAQKHINEGNLLVQNDFLRATPSGLLLIDHIAGDLFQ